MTIFKATLKRLFRQKSNLLFLIVLPLIFMIIAFSGSNGTAPLKVTIIDNDKTAITEGIINTIKDKAEVNFDSEDTIQDNLINNEIDYAIVIPKSYTDSLINREDPILKTYEAKEGNTSTAIKASLNNYINILKTFAKNSNGDKDKFYDAVKYYSDGSYKLSYTSVDKGEGNKSKTDKAMAFIVLNLLFSATSATNIILKDREKNVFTRLFTTPMTRFKYIFQSLLSFLVITFVQITLYFLVFKYVFKFNLGDSPLSLYTLFLIFGIFTISLGVFITTHSKDLRISGTISTLIILPFAMLGGCFWPIDVMPNVLKNISKFIPTTWINNSNSNVLYGSTLNNEMTTIALLLGLSLILLGLSSNKLKNRS
ncbi:ABC transporter permease [Clostridium sp. Sa3CUN1]|uniref:ABC transporter permease n=1 Tax=Clostridium gallinarum TaxID=2762246 RepID=A0ABR8Q5A8_9CLOT|nr:ABC transporter permease [Clostridium gallinarum]MBD7915599.1 ABC transporter permease [Clostridium gallinarum]